MSAQSSTFSKLGSVAQIIGRSLLVGVAYAVVSTALGALLGLGEPGASLWQSGPWEVLAGTLMILVFTPVVLRGPWRGATLFAVIWLPFFYIAFPSIQLIETYIFTDIPLATQLLMNLRGLLVTLGATYLIVVLFGRLRPEVAEKPAVPALARRPWFSYLWRILVCALIYLFLYFLVGGITYQAFTRPFYEDLSLGLMPVESVNMGTLTLVQIVRGLLFVLVLLPIASGMRISRRSLALTLGLILWVVGGLAPLVVPSAMMPPALRFYHAIEIFFQNFFTGVAIAYLVGRP